MNAETDRVERVIGIDAHPDTFTAAILQGLTPAAAVVQRVFNKLPIGHLQTWAQKHTNPQDVFVLEASGNSFHIVRVLAKSNRKALVLESGHLGKLKEAHANNDKISAVRIGKAVRRTTQLRNRLQSYLSDNGVRLKKGTRLTQAPNVETIRNRHAWQPTISQPVAHPTLWSAPPSDARPAR